MLTLLAQGRNAARFEWHLENTVVVVSILVSQRSREAREQELHHLNLILERLDHLERKIEDRGSR